MMFQHLILSACCPKPAALGDITPQLCPEHIGQIQRLWFVRKGAVTFDLLDPANNTPVAIAGLGNEVEEEAPWLILFAAVDDSHVIKTPFVTGGGDSAITPVEPSFFGGGDNSTFSGKKQFVGFNPSDGALNLHGLSGQVIADIRALICEGELEMYFINQENKIIGAKVGDTLTGFCASAVVLGSMTNAGFNTLDSNLLTFQLDFDWDEKKHFITPNAWSPLAA